MERERIFREEENNLKRTIELINKKLESAQRNFDDQKHFIIGFKEGMRGTQFTRQGLMSIYSTEISDLKILSKNPYFGKMDFLENGSNELQSIYIGRKALVDENGKILSYDWRSPISSMYYDYSLGPAEYEYNGEKVEGELLKKRQLTIEDGKLINVQEQDTLTNDKILLSCLNENADSRLKSIIATIQKEQNKIIRNPLKNNYIVQGVAGSGKTTVALHRIAYLLYNESKNINESEFMILGPNKYFLNYISELLPDLDINSVSQSTFEEIALDNIDSKVKLENQNDTLQNILLNQLDSKVVEFKSSLEFLKLIDKFVNQYMSSHLSEPIKYADIEICSVNSLRLLLDNFSTISHYSYADKIKNLEKKLIKRVKENSEDLCEDVWLRYRDEFLSLSKDDPRSKEIINITNEIQKNIQNGCKKQIKEYFKFANINSLSLYTAFIENIDEYVNDNDVNCHELKKYTLEKLKKKKIGYEDLAPLLYINYLIKGVSICDEFSHLVIDEGQDLSLPQYYILKLLFPNCIFDVFGDLNQSIYSYQGINNWDELNKLIFNSKSNLIELNKGYRTTAQISDTSNYVLNELGKSNSECIARDGEEISFNESSNLDIDLLKQIEMYLDKKYKTIAVICKDSKETDLVHKKLTKLGLNIHKISEEDLTYNGGLCIMPTYLSKGLEFDAVIIYDANDKKYNSESTIDMKLLYVAITRALHELSINYNGELTKPLNRRVNEKTNQKVLKK